MGSSQETFSKKEKEKKRLKKKQDKDLKKEERKANSDKGKGLDEMMAYVDENGNVVYNDLVSVAIWIPETIGKDLIRQPDNI